MPHTIIYMSVYNKIVKFKVLYLVKIENNTFGNILQFTGRLLLTLKTLSKPAKKLYTCF